MERRISLCACLVALILVGETLGQDALHVEADELRFEIARLKALLSECQERLEAIEEQPSIRFDWLFKTPPLALDGFCPVALVEDMRRAQPKWTPGHREITREYDGLKYRFSSRDALRTFELAPCEYALALQGYDPVIAMDEDRRVPGCRNFGARWRDRTYLLSSKESYDAFQDSPQKYANFACDVPSVERRRDVWSAPWACFCKYRPMEAWIIRRFYKAYRSLDERGTGARKSTP